MWEGSAHARRGATLAGTDMSRTILIVEDSAELVQLYRVALGPSGYRFLVAGDGREALLAMGMHEPDVILLDMAMPGMDGLEFLRVLRDAPEWRHVPVIMITAFGTADDVRATGRFAVAAHMLKAGFSCRELRERVAACLAHSVRGQAKAA